MSEDYGFVGKRKTKKDLWKKRKQRVYKKGGQNRDNSKVYKIV
jgi:hypothetical protein